MPIYDYVCASCRHRIEVIHGIHEAGPRFCPSCGEEATMRKALVSPAIHFKGSGWAKKDRSSTSGTRARSGSGSADGGSGDGSAREGGLGDGASGDGASGGGSGSTGKDATGAESGSSPSTRPSTSTPTSED